MVYYVQSANENIKIGNMLVSFLNIIRERRFIYASGKEYTYIAIDLKSFYASVECIERNLDPLHTNLVVADASRTEPYKCRLLLH